MAADNPHNYCVASQDAELRKELRRVPGVPLIHINRSVVVLEPPSKATKEKIAEREKAKTLPNEKEHQFMQKKKKRKGPKQPNPLSMKKKKKPKVGQPAATPKPVEA
jgi:U3 small nucleolar RNA-associated protein 23